MFVTTNTMRLEVASQLMPGVDVWDAVEVELQMPILLLTIAAAGNTSGGVPYRTFLGKPHHLNDFDGTSDARISSVDLFSPSHLNGTGSWQLDRLTEVWECREPSDDASAWLFVLADGRLLADSLHHTRADHLVRRRRAYTGSNGHDLGGSNGRN